MKKKLFAVGAVAAALLAYGQDAASARAAYQQQQAVQEVQRLSQQFDLLVNNVDAIAARLVKLEGTDAAGDLRAEVAALRGAVADLKRDQARMRQEIVEELSRKMSAYIAQHKSPGGAPVAARPAAPPPARTPPPRQTAPAKPEISGPYYEHVVESGQTLSLIARGYDTTVQKILNANPGVKPQTLRVGQKLIIPAEEGK